MVVARTLIVTLIVALIVPPTATVTVAVCQ
jgi:hypothetical protein